MIGYKPTGGLKFQKITGRKPLASHNYSLKHVNLPYATGCLQVKASSRAAAGVTIKKTTGRPAIPSSWQLIGRLN
jgi:hypothetical protein